MLYNKIPESRPFLFLRFDYTENHDDIIAPQHYHNFFEIYFVESGNCDYFIDNKSYHLEAGDLVIIPEGVIHNTRYHKNNPAVRLLINCSKKYIPKSAEFVFAKRKYLYRNSNISDKLLDLLNKIGDEYSDSDEFSKDVIKNYMSLFFYLLARNKNEYNEDNSLSGYIKNAIDYIQKNLANEISLSDMSEMFSVSAEHFSRQFKKETGFGFCEYVNLIRLKKAENILRHQEKISVTSVAAECGFSDSNYFSVKFKDMYGISPKAFHKLSREN